MSAAIKNRLRVLAAGKLPEVVSDYILAISIGVGLALTLVKWWST